MIMRLIFVSLLCVLNAGDALSHTKMSESTPEEGSTAKAGLSEIQLGFVKPVRLVMVNVRNSDRDRDIKVQFQPAGSYKTTFSFKVAPLATGRHTVNWTAIAEHGHIMKGALSFRIAK